MFDKFHEECGVVGVYGHPEAVVDAPLVEGSLEDQALLERVFKEYAIDAVVRLYDRLFLVEDPSGDDWLQHLNPDSLETITAKLEPSLAVAAPDLRIADDERHGLPMHLVHAVRTYFQTVFSGL